MKVGILTFPNSTSYGASLQMYALYRAVQKVGGDAEIINYQNLYMKADQHTTASRNTRIKNICRRMLHYRQVCGFRDFEKSMLLYPTKVINDSDMLIDIGKRYESVICGSDQVWNPDITGNDLSYFLNFCTPMTKRISYAPSFGRDELEEDFLIKIEKELHKFQHLSVRETEGQAILQRIMASEVPVVLDPTFLLTKNDWMKLEKKYLVGQEPYILYYTVRRSDKLFHFCTELAEKKNMKVVIVGGNAIRWACNKNKRIDYAWDIEPREWLYLLHHADCIVTNSFHGTAFSINYQKDFYVEFSSLTNSRMEHIIRTMGLNSRVVWDGHASSEEHIDYDKVGKIVCVLRESSYEYLRKAIISEWPEAT